VAERRAATARELNAAIAYLERTEAELGDAAGWLDDRDLVRASAMLMSAQRSILAACYLIAPPSPAELTDVIEQRQQR
jgi:hypothetical protein